MANFFWVGGSATWDSTAGSKWAASSGAAASYIIAPTILDDVYFDAASGASTVVFASGINCRSLNFTGFTGSFTGASAANTVNIYGGLTMGTGMTVPAATNTFNFAATTTNAGAGHPITSNGKTLPKVTFNGVGGKWTLQDALTCNALTLTAGTFDTNNQAITAYSFTSSGSAVRVLTLGSTTLTIPTWDVNSIAIATAANLTITANTATLVVSGRNAQVIFDVSTWSGTTLVLSGVGQQIISTTGATITNVTRTGTAVTTDSLQIKGGNLTIPGTLTLTGNSSINRLLCASDVLGTPRVITAAATALTDVDFMDIAIAGPTGSTITSDSFNRSNGALHGSTSDAAAGGSGLTWSAGGNFNITSNASTANSSSSYITIPVATSNMEVSALVPTLPTGGHAGVAARISSITNMVFFGVSNASTQSTLYYSIGSTFNSVACGLVSAGSTISLRVIDQIAVALVNGTVVGTLAIPAASSFTSPNNAGLQQMSTGTIDDFVVKNLASVTGTRLGDCLGNSGIEFTTASGTARDGGGVGVKRYAVAPGNFSSTAMWSESSGGSPGASVPLPQDDVYLDANSAAGTYAINMPRSCRNLDCTGFTRTLNNSASDWSLYGNLKIVPGMTWSFTSIGPNLRGRGTQTIDTSGIVPGGGITNTNIISPGGSYTLLSNLSLGLATQSYFGHFAGTFNANGFDVTTGRIDSPGSLVRTLNLGSGTWRVGYNTPFVVSISATTSLVADSSTIIVDSVYTAERSFTAPTGSVFGTLTYTVADSPGALTITGSNTFNTLNIGSGRSLRLTSGTTQKIGTLNLNGVPRGGVRLPGVGGTYLSTPDSAAVSVTGDIDIRVRVALTDWTPGASQALIGKYVSTANQGSYILAIDTGGRPNFLVSDSGGGGSWVYVGGAAWVDGTTYWVRVTHTMAGLLRFFYAADSSTMPTSWTQLGSDQTAFTYGKYDSTAPLEIGSYGNGVSMNAVGTFYRAQIRNNVLDDGSGIVFDTDLTVPFGPRFYDTANGAVVTPSNTLANVGDGRVVIESATANSPATLQVDTATGMNYVDLKDVVMNGADTYIGATSVIRSNVKGVRRGPQTGMSMMMGV